MSKKTLKRVPCRPVRLSFLLLATFAACERNRTIVEPPAVVWIATPSVVSPGDTVELSAIGVSAPKSPSEVRIEGASVQLVGDSSTKRVRFLAPLIAPGEVTLSLHDGGTALGSVKLRVRPLPIVQGKRDATVRLNQELEVARRMMDSLQLEATESGQPDFAIQAVELRDVLDSAGQALAALTPAQQDSAEAVLEMLERISGTGAPTLAGSLDWTSSARAGPRDQVEICNELNNVVENVEGAGKVSSVLTLLTGIGVLLVPETAGLSLVASAAIAAAAAKIAVVVTATTSIAYRTLSFHVPAPATLGGSLYLEFDEASGGIGTEAKPDTKMRLVPLSALADDGALLGDIIALLPGTVSTRIRVLQVIGGKAGEIVTKIADKFLRRAMQRVLQKIDDVWKIRVNSRVQYVVQHVDPRNFGSVEFRAPTSELYRDPDGSFMMRVLMPVPRNQLRTFEPTWEGSSPATPECQPVARDPDASKGFNAFTLIPRTVTLDVTIPRVWVLGQAAPSSDESGIGINNKYPVPLELGLSLLPPSQGVGTKIELSTNRVSLAPRQNLKYNDANAPRLRVTAQPGTAGQVLAIPVIARLGSTVVACQVVEATIDPPGGTLVEEDALTFPIAGGASAPNGKMAARLTWNGTSSIVQWPVGDQVTVSRSLRDGPNELQIGMAQGSGTATYRLPQPFGTGEATDFSYKVHTKKFFRVRHPAPSLAEQEAGIDAAYATCAKYGL